MGFTGIQIKKIVGSPVGQAGQVNLYTVLKDLGLEAQVELPFADPLDRGGYPGAGQVKEPGCGEKHGVFGAVSVPGLQPNAQENVPGAVVF